MSSFLALTLFSWTSLAADDLSCTHELVKQLDGKSCVAQVDAERESGLGSISCGKRLVFLSIHFEKYNTWMDSHLDANSDPQIEDPLVSEFRDAWTLDSQSSLSLIVTRPVCTSEGVSWWPISRVIGK